MSRAIRFAFTFNTGRQYQPAGHKFAGQVITVEAELVGDQITVKFIDRSRGLDGGFKAFYDPRLVGGSDERAIKSLVMNFYDNNKHVALDHFEYLEREAAKASPAEPTLEQLLALRAWSIAMGRTWRMKLLTAWEVAGQGYGAYTPQLQQLRNNFGPEWLVKFSNAKLRARLAQHAPPAISGDAFSDN